MGNNIILTYDYLCGQSPGSKLSFQCEGCHFRKLASPTIINVKDAHARLVGLVLVYNYRLYTASYFPAV